MRMTFALLSIAFSALSALATVSPAQANCYENFGCTDSEYFAAKQLEQASCQVLWEVRNTIFKERGYCFGTAKAVKAFGNAGCQYDNVEDLPLSANDHRAIADIIRQERALRCPR